MKQKLLYIIMFIVTLAWSGEAWADDWDQWFGKSGSGTQQGDTWYVLYNADEDFVGVGVGIPTSKEFNLLGPGTNLTFEANRNMATGIGSLKIEKYVNNATIRREMGRDIDGACGQLRKRKMDASKGTI